MRVLYVNHTGSVSGAERSLLTLLEELPESVQGAVACPEGDLMEALRGRGIPTWRIQGTDASLRLSPVRTPRGVIEMLRSGWEVRRAARQFGADLVHASTVRAGLITALASRLGGPPTVVHVHDRLPPGAVPRIVQRAICGSADAILTCSDYTARPLSALRQCPPITVVHNPVNVEQFDPARFDRDELRGRLGLEPATVALAVTAQITPWKGQDDAVRALATVRAAHPEVELLLVGSPKFVSSATRYDNLAFSENLDRLIASLGVEGSVARLGERADVAEILGAIDVALIPSWEEPFGIAMIEAMAMKVPVIATSVGGATEIIDGTNGLLAPPRRPDLWASAIRRLIEDRQLREAMGEAAREQVVRTLSAPVYARRVLSAYELVLDGG
jgi:glycosyltransferase involved in cell wall biosynthesis